MVMRIFSGFLDSAPTGLVAPTFLRRSARNDNGSTVSMGTTILDDRRKTAFSLAQSGCGDPPAELGINRHILLGNGALCAGGEPFNDNAVVGDVAMIECGDVALYL